MKKITYKNTDETVYYEKLSNGLEIFMYPSDTAKNFYLTFSVKFGSIDTEFKKNNEKNYTQIPNGTAHFLEHQMFQEESGHTVFEYFAELGSSVNAFTTYGFTCYEVVASDNFKENLNYLLDYVQNPVFKEKSVSKEKGIIKEEIKMYDNIPSSVLNFGLENNLNVVDKHKYTISGTIDDIAGISAEILEDTYNTFYYPGNMFIVLTGKFSPLEALGIIKENQSSKEFNYAPKKVTRKKVSEPMEVCTPYECLEMDVSVPKIKIAYKLDKNKFKSYSALELKIYLSAILDIKFGPTSDLFEKLNGENLIMWNLYTAREIRDDYILITFETETKYKEQVIDLIKQELKNIRISKEELERQKKYNIANFILHFDDIIRVAEDIQDDFLENGRIVDELMDYYENMNLSSINTIAKKLSGGIETIFYIDKIPVQ